MTADWGSSHSCSDNARGSLVPSLTIVGFVPFLQMKLYLRSKYVKQIKEECQWLIGPPLQCPRDIFSEQYLLPLCWVSLGPRDTFGFKEHLFDSAQDPHITFLGRNSVYTWKGSLERVPDVLGDSGDSLLLLLNPLVLWGTIAHGNTLDLFTY